MRPRRFGKSLFLSMLEYYYDVAYRDEFDTLFGKLYIGQHPTTYHNTYPILLAALIPTMGMMQFMPRLTAKLPMHLKLFQKIMGKGGFVRSFYEVLRSAWLLVTDTARVEVVSLK